MAKQTDGKRKISKSGPEKGGQIFPAGMRYNGVVSVKSLRKLPGNGQRPAKAV